MKAFIGELIERLEEEKGTESDYVSIEGKKLVRHWNNCVDVCKEVAKKLIEEYPKKPTPNHPIPIDTQQYIAELERKLKEKDWIPCDKELPPQPRENPLFENKPLELYLVSLNSTDYPWRAFWNGKFFTDGWSKVEPTAWMPLPASYKAEV